MRKRQLKKFAKAAKKNRRPYQTARGRGSRKDCRRKRAFDRLSRKIRHERIRKMDACMRVLEQIDAYTPRNDQEALGLIAMRAKVQNAFKKHQEQLSIDEDIGRMEQQMAIVKHLVEGLARSVG